MILTSKTDVCHTSRYLMHSFHMGKVLGLLVRAVLDIQLASYLFHLPLPL